MSFVTQHHQVNLQTGVLSVANLAWGGNALQTINIARHFPKNPQQAIGYRGIVDYTSGPQTTDITLDCMLTEDTCPAVAGVADGSPGGTSVYHFAEKGVQIGSEFYALTSCRIGLQAGNPATVSYGWITAGAGSELDGTATPDVLTRGEEAAFAIVMGDDGSGVTLTPTGIAAVPSGVQSLNFSATLNRDQVLDVRSSSPIEFITTYPVDITMDIETLNKTGTTFADMTALTVATAGLNNHNAAASPTVVDGFLTDGTWGSKTTPYAAVTKNLVIASGLTRMEETDNMNVGGYLTYTYNFNCADLCIPLRHIDP